MKLVGERRALSAIIFAFYALLFLAVAINPDLPPGVDRPFYGLATVYALAMFSLIAGYFWARWYSVGIGLFGLILAALLTWQSGQLVFQFTFLGGTHLAAVAMLWGDAMSESYDGQQAWRQKLHMDENAVQRLGRSVIRAGVSLPFVLLYALAPRPTGALVLALGALGLAGVGLRALIKARTWGVFAIGAAGVMMLGVTGFELAAGHDMIALKPALGGALLVFAATPWLKPAARFVRA